jgi:transcriptional regulator with XRE-family HTH domain
MMRLRKYLQSTGLTQSALAFQLAVWPSTISSWLSGRRTPSRALALELEKVTGGQVPASCW